LSDAQTLMEKIAALPAERFAEVEDFVDFLAQKGRRQTAIDRLLALAPALEAAGAEPVAETDILAELEAARAERPARRKASGSGAGRP